MKDLQKDKLSMEASQENVKLKDKVTEELNQKQDLHLYLLEVNARPNYRLC